MESNWQKRLELADRKIEIYTNILNCIRQEIESYELKEGTAYWELKAKELSYEMEVDAQKHFKESLIKDKQEQEAFFEAQKTYALENADKILKKANSNLTKSNPNYPQVQVLKHRLGELGADAKGEQQWVNVILEIEKLLK